MMNDESGIDVGILTIKEEEFTALLDAFPCDSQLFVGPKSQRHYNLRSADAGGGARYRLAILRLVEQGNGEAQEAARDFIEELRPALVLVVGIAGGVPSDDVTLGDVVLSLRIHDYSLRAENHEANPEYAISGGPVEQAISRGVVNLPARQVDLGDWTTDLPERPPVEVIEKNLKGPEDWKRRVRHSLEHHFQKETRTAPHLASGVLGSSDALIKDPDILIAWLTTARNLLAVEMESAGVYRATRGKCAMLAIRGISDVVGFSRDERWTRYACAAAAAFARAYLRTTPVTPPRQNSAGYSRVGSAAPTFNTAFRIANDCLRRGRGQDGEEALVRLINRADAERNTEWALRARLALVSRKTDPLTLGEAERLLTECEVIAKNAQVPPAVEATHIRVRCRLALQKGEDDWVEPLLATLAGRDFPEEDPELAYEILRAGTDLAMLQAGLGRPDESKRWADLVQKRASCAALDEHRSSQVRGSVEEVSLRLAIERGDCSAVETIVSSWTHSLSRDDAAENAGVLIHYANMARHLKQYICGIPCAAGAALLGRTAELQELVLGADQTHATLLCMAGRHSDGLRINDAVLMRAEAAGSAKVVVAARLLAADHALQQQDAARAKGHAEAARRAAQGDEVAEVMSLQCLADACWLEGDSRAAHDHVAEALRLGTRLGMPASERARLLHMAVDAVGQEGLWDKADYYLTEWDQVPLADNEGQAERAAARQRVDGYRQLRATFESLRVNVPQSTQNETVQMGIARIVAPVFEWWDDLQRASPDQLDYWGRGNFVRVVKHIQCYPRSFVVVVEARSRSDIERAIRLCGLLADVVLVLWKGPCVEGRMLAMAPFHHRGPGGAGYVLAAGSRLEREGVRGTWVPAFTTGRYLPEEIVDLLAKDGRRWFESGRLLVIPAWSVGCINPTFGPLERLLSNVMHALPVARSAAPISLPWQLVPWFPEVPLANLADVAGDPTFSRPRLRQLLMERTRKFAESPAPFAERELEAEIEAELGELQHAVERQQQRHSWRVARESWTTARVRPVTESSAAGTSTELSPWIPFLRVGQLGYEWQVVRVSEALPQFRETPDQEAGHFKGGGEWLAPEDSGPIVPTVHTG